MRDTSLFTNHDALWLFGAGRLKPGVTLSQARAGLAVLSHHLQQAYPKSNADREAAAFPVTLVPAPLRGYVEAFAGLLMAVVGLVLLIACANAANLLLAQATARRREMAIRVALGAGRGRLIRQMLIESTLVAFLGGCVAFLLASWIAPALLALKPPSLPIKFDAPMDWRVLAFTLALSLGTGIIFGLAPALRSARLDVIPVLKDEGGIGGYRRSKLRSVLVAAQISVCLLLLISAGLCVRSLMNAQSIDPGFDTQHILMAELDPGSLGYSETKGRAFYQELIGRIEALPGVTSVSTAADLPLGGMHMGVRAAAGGRPVPAEGLPFINSNEVGPGYFRTMGISLLRGREFTTEDGPDSPGVAIINQAMAKKYWPGENPVGLRLLVQNVA